jgi:lipopolysaccharide transport system permease protein
MNMTLQELHGINLEQRPGRRYRPLPGTIRWSLCCLFAALLGCCLMQPTTLFAAGPLVTQEICYRMPEAGEVFLVWGVDGWQIVPEDVRPSGTTVKDNVMHTPMLLEGDTFVAKVQVPPGATIDYGFLITKTRSGSAIELWEANGGQDYHTVATQDDIVQVQTGLTLPQDQAALPASGAVLPLAIGLSAVVGIGATFVARRYLATSDFKTSLYARRVVYLRDLLRELVARDMKLRYKRSILGVAWSLVNPLAQLLVFVFLFRAVLPLNVPNYPSFVLSGLLAWSWFQSSLILATGAITDNRELIRRPGFPAAILPIVTVTTHLVHFLLALPVLLLFLVFSGGRLTETVLALPLVIALQFWLTLSLGYLVAAFHVTFRDTQHLLGVLLLLLFYLTPIFYDASAVPARYQPFYRLNPMVYLIDAYRAILIRGTLPDGLSLLGLSTLAGVLLWVGYTTFTWMSYRFVEEL